MKRNLVINIAILSFLLLLLALIVFSCKRVISPTKIPQGEVEEWQTPKANREAEEAALWLSDSLVAPDYLYSKILHHLAAIREKYGEEIPQVHITFTPPWVPSCIFVKVTDEAKQQILDGEYHDLDSLNSALRYKGGDITSVLLGNFIILSFEGRLHPSRLVELYEKVSSVVLAEPNYFLGDWSNVYSWFADDGLSYLFREAWGDCPSGCIYSCYWYFKASISGVNSIGVWCPPGPEPEWWEEAEQGMIHY